MNKLKILILGKDGMLGHMLNLFFESQKEYIVSSWDRKKLDINMNSSKIEHLLELESSDVIINCIGLINKYANEPGMESQSKKINTDFPHLLAYLSIKNKYKLIHISTDCYLDKDVYGKSKYFGEINDKINLTIRTSIIGPEIKNGSGLFHWFMNESKEVPGYTKAKWDGVTTLQLAKFINNCIKNKKTGILDYRTKKIITKYKLLELSSRVFNKNILIKKDKRKIKDKRNKQPEFWCKKSYDIQLLELRNFMEKHKDVYKKYFK